MCILHETGERLVNLAFMPVFKPHTHKLDILRHCTNIVYLLKAQNKMKLLKFLQCMIYYVKINIKGYTSKICNNHMTWNTSNACQSHWLNKLEPIRCQIPHDTHSQSMSVTLTQQVWANQVSYTTWYTPIVCQSPWPNKFEPIRCHIPQDIHPLYGIHTDPTS
jgi:hypothetical protein